MMMIQNRRNLVSITAIVAKGKRKFTTNANLNAVKLQVRTVTKLFKVTITGSFVIARV